MQILIWGRALNEIPQHSIYLGKYKRENHGIEKGQDFSPPNLLRKKKKRGTDKSESTAVESSLFYEKYMTLNSFIFPL